MSAGRATSRIENDKGLKFSKARYLEGDLSLQCKVYLRCVLSGILGGDWCHYRVTEGVNSEIICRKMIGRPGEREGWSASAAGLGLEFSPG